MKILYLHQYFKFPDETGGTRSYDLASSFAKHNIEVLVVTSTSDKRYKTKQRWVEIERDGIRVQYISDRLHVLIAAFTKGVITINLAADYSTKVEEHFTVIGINNVTVDCARVDEEEALRSLAELVDEGFNERALNEARMRLINTKKLIIEQLQ